MRLLGPSDLLDTSATPAALARAGVALLAGLGLLGLVAALRSRGMTEHGIGVRPGVLARVPWELAVLALAAAICGWYLWVTPSNPLPGSVRA